MDGDPDFILAGAHKSGTTSLMRALEGHSKVGRPAADEPHTLIHATFSRFQMNDRSIESLVSAEEYRRIHDTEKFTCDGSVLYLPHSQEFLDSYEQLLPSKPPVLVILRNPVDRAWSAYNYARLLNSEENALDFDEALADGDRRWNDSSVASSLSYRRLSQYASDVRRLQDRLQARLLVVTFESLIADFELQSKAILDHIGLDFEPLELGRSNPGGTWSNGVVSSLAKNIHVRRITRRLRGASRPADWAAAAAQRRFTESAALPPDRRAELAELMEPEIAELERVLGRRLSEWRDDDANLL